MTRELRCDFCSASDPAWKCPCGDSPLAIPDRRAPGPPRYHYSVGAWLACEPCAQLILQARRDDLQMRACVGFRRQLRRDDPESSRVLSDGRLALVVRGMHDDYWSTRQGPPRLMTALEQKAERELPDEIQYVVAGPPPAAPRWAREAGLT